MSRRKWSANDLAILAAYPDGGIAQLARRLGRSEDSVSGMARRAGLRIGPSMRFRSRAAGSRSVNAHFFDTLSPQVAFVLGVVWCRGIIRDAPRKVLILDCPEEMLPILESVRALMRSRHAIQQKARGARLEICNSYLVRSSRQQLRLAARSQ